MKVAHPRAKALVFALALATGQLYAQSTSSGMVGRVTNAEGAPIAGATVEIVHTPTGTRRTVTTDAEGRYGTRGLRVGGPFTVTVVAEGYEGLQRDDVYLRLDETTTVNIEAEVEATEMEAVEVVGVQTSMFDPTRMGTVTNIPRDQIASLPSISRSIDDFVRTDPRIVQIDKSRGGLSVAGQNNRYNSITIDGVPTNDPFGLNDSGLASLSQPISLDTIEEISIGISNYDVTQGDFVGGNINAITKSGTNEFHGTAYFNYRDNDMVSDEPNDFTAFTRDRTYGATLGGPILKDNLFFFVSYEKSELDLGSPSIGLVGETATTNLRFITPADLAQVRQIAQSQYGFDIGQTSIPAVRADEKLLAKIDWNINDSQRFSFRYNVTEGDQLIYADLNSGSYSLSSQWYLDDRKTEAYVGTLYSDWSDTFSTEASISYTTYDAISKNFVNAPDVSIRFGNGAENLRFGTDQFRHRNEIATETTTAFFAGTWFLGDHTLKFGFDYKEDDIFNLFGRDLFGVYTFNSVADFAAGRYNSYFLREPRPGQPVETIAADWALENLGLFVQDSWTVNTNLSILFGVRLDIPEVGDSPVYNPLFESTFGFRNDTTIDGNEIISPRVGFNYTFDTERPTQLRGGVGLFSGSAANVWLSNPFSNTGLNFIQYNISNGTSGFTFDPNNQPRPANPQNIEQVVDVVDPDFEQPTVWKANLGIDHELPWMGLVASAEAQFTSTENAIYYEHLNLGAPAGLLPDGRLHYFANTRTSGAGACITSTTGAAPSNACTRANRRTAFGDVLLLRNTSKGHAQTVTLALDKPMNDDNWAAKLAYTWTDSEEVNPGTSSQAASNWNARQIFNHDEEAGTANYQIRDRIVATYTHRFYFFEDLATKVSMFGEARSGRPFSYVFANDANGDRIAGNDLFFIPNRGDVQFTANTTPAQIEQFFSYIENNRYLSSRAGGVAERNTNEQPWTTQIDLRISQEIPLAWRAKGELFFDVLNVGNLIDKSWGQIDEYPFPFGVRLANFSGVDPTTGRYIYSLPVTSTGNFNPTQLERRDNNAQSRWAAQVGFRVEF